MYTISKLFRAQLTHFILLNPPYNNNNGSCSMKVCQNTKSILSYAEPFLITPHTLLGGCATILNYTSFSFGWCMTIFNYNPFSFGWYITILNYNLFSFAGAWPLLITCHSHLDGAWPFSITTHSPSDGAWRSLITSHSLSDGTRPFLITRAISWVDSDNQAYHSTY